MVSGVEFKVQPLDRSNGPRIPKKGAAGAVQAGASMYAALNDVVSKLPDYFTVTHATDENGITAVQISSPTDSLIMPGDGIPLVDLIYEVDAHTPIGRQIDLIVSDVVITDAKGDTIPLEEVQNGVIRVAEGDPPDQPTGLTATAENNLVMLRWNPVPAKGLARYQIHRDTESPATTIIGANLAMSPPDTSFADSTAVNGTTYYYRVTAVDSAGSVSAFSNEVSATPFVISVRVDPDSLDLGEVDTGAVKDTTFTITNTGTDTLKIMSITSTHPAVTTSPVVTAKPTSRPALLATMLAPGLAMADTVRFAPTSGDSVHALVIIESNADSSPDTIHVWGVGRTRTLAISSDSSSVAFVARDSTKATIDISGQGIAGRKVTFSSFGSDPPQDVMSAPPFDKALYIELSSDIPDSVSFTAKVTLVLTGAQLAAAGITDEVLVMVAVFNPLTNTWDTVDAMYDPDTNTVMWTTNHFSFWVIAPGVPTGIADGEGGQGPPKVYTLAQNTPNPFNPSTTIAYEVPQQAHITLTVYNILGQEVVRLVDEVHTPGRYTVVWQGRNGQGLSVATGVYVYRLTSSTGYTQVRRMTLLK